MRTGILACALLVSFAVLAPRPARACGSGGSGGAIALGLTLGGGLAATDVGFTIHDLAVDEPSRGYAVAETLITVPQVVLGAYLVNISIDEGSTAGVLFTGGYTLWTAVLAYNGIRGMLADRSTESEAPSAAPMPYGGQLGAVRFSVVPAAVSDGVQQGTGLGLVGTF